MAEEGTGRLGERLLEAGVIDEDELRVALQRQENEDLRLGTILLDRGAIEEEDLVEFLARKTDCMVLNLDNYPVNSDVLSLLSREQAERYRAVPVFRDDEVLTVAMQDPLDLVSVDDLEMITNLEVEPAVAPASEIDRYIRRAYEDAGRSDSSDPSVYLLSPEEGEFSETLEDQTRQTAQGKMVNRILRSALDRNASTIHIDPRADRVNVEFRIHGTMRHFTDLPLAMRDSLVSRFDVLTERPGALWGAGSESLRIQYDDELISLKMNTVETRFGEKMVVQIRWESLYQRNLSELGFDDVSDERLQSLLAAPRGLILFAGPDNSGKKTTLYTSLNHLSRSPLSMVTVEDPVDFELDVCSQIEVDPGDSRAKAEGVRAALDADPDVLMVSDVGDPPVAQATLEAAARGLRVLSTFHADNSLDAVYHLTHKEGVDRFLLANSLIGVVSQRLVRVPREEARQPYEPTDQELARLNLPADGDYFRVVDDHQRQNPYRAVTGLYQVLPITNQLRRCVLDGESHAAFEKAAESIPLETLRQKGARKIREGKTSIEEVLRVTFREDLTEDFHYPGDT